MDFAVDVKNNNALIWAINPRQTDIFTAVDSSTSDKKKRIPIAPKDNQITDLSKKRIIAFGNAKFGSSVKGKFPAPTRRITDAIKKMSKELKGNTFIYIDEYLTSQTYLTNITTSKSKSKLHVVLKCNSCSMQKAL
ncbi:uncharacterized protein BX663DRAFT_499367 [Cokeromyces recurvatus]|uniref:uncharacterized protein n=1 Tax=Cokeromyces recurvatus TaxID=90255 RepID=UPI00221F350A|nr:uncharacterized protein BX663DRAFT_499367 [Cokeromyces recurvatus]KAI7906246.1 hypothetical protein BX663DRAFT_499367 [Cokeromyces recurvatus]